MENGCGSHIMDIQCRRTVSITLSITHDICMYPQCSINLEMYVPSRYNDNCSEKHSTLVSDHNCFVDVGNHYCFVLHVLSNTNT